MNAATGSAPRIRAWSVVVLVGLALLAALAWLPAHPFVDERAHWPAAQMFAHGGWRLDPAISTWPTLNALLGWTLAPLGLADRLTAGRLVIVAWTLLGVLAFFRLASFFDAASARLRTAQFFLSPVVLPFGVLVYTDVPALSALLWAALGALRRQPWLLLGAGALACAMRQSNLSWFVALFGLYAWRCLDAGARPQWRHLLAAVLVVVAWCAAVWLQGGVALGVETQMDHPGKFRGVPNMEFALMVAAIVYLPYFLFRLATAAPIRLHHLLALGLAVALSFHVTHRFNLLPTTYFLRNDLLRWTAFGPGLGVLTVVVTITAVLVFRTRPAALAGLRLPFLAAAAASLLPFWLIEQRYYLPIYAFFWAMRPAVGRRVEYVQLGWGIILCAWIVALIARGVNFL